MVEALLILVVACIAGVIWYSIATRRRIERLENESRARLGEARAEHEKRVDRLNRKFDDVSKRGHLDFAADLLPALDALGHALSEANQSDADEADQPQTNKSEKLAALREGLEMVDRELETILAKHGIEVCNPAPGAPFDPNVHEAVSTEESEDFGPGCVTECYRPGYVHDDRVLRAAMVAVTSRASRADEDSADEDSADEDSTGENSGKKDSADGAADSEDATDQAGISPVADGSPTDVDDAPPADPSSSRL